MIELPHSISRQLQEADADPSPTDGLDEEEEVPEPDDDVDLASETPIKPPAPVDAIGDGVASDSAPDTAEPAPEAPVADLGSGNPPPPESGRETPTAGSGLL